MAGNLGVAAPSAVELARDTLNQLGQLSKSLPEERYYTDAFIKPANDFDRAALLALPPRF